LSTVSRAPLVALAQGRVLRRAPLVAFDQRRGALTEQLACQSQLRVLGAQLRQLGAQPNNIRACLRQRRPPKSRSTPIAGATEDHHCGDQPSPIKATRRQG